MQGVNNSDKLKGSDIKRKTNRKKYQIWVNEREIMKNKNKVTIVKN